MRTPPSPRAWRCIARGRRREWFDSETRARTTPKTAREESPERFARWPSAPTRRRKRRASPVTGMLRVFPVMGMLTPPPTLPVMEMSTIPVMPSPRVTAGTSRAVPLRRMPTRFAPRCATVPPSSGCTATTPRNGSSISLSSAESHSPSSRVACVPARFLIDGCEGRRCPRTTTVEYLVSKAPGKIGVARLGFEGKDHVVYSTWGETRGVGGGRRIERVDRKGRDVARGGEVGAGNAVDEGARS